MATLSKIVVKLNSKKNKYLLSKMLTDEQFLPLSSTKKKFLMIQWDSPDKSLLDLTGGSRAKQNKLLPSPPTKFAISNKFEDNLKSIRQWWRMGRQQQMIATQWYDDMIGQEEKICLQKNITHLMEEQLKFYRKKACQSESDEESISSKESNGKSSVSDEKLTLSRQINQLLVKIFILRVKQVLTILRM